MDQAAGMLASARTGCAIELTPFAGKRPRRLLACCTVASLSFSPGFLILGRLARNVKSAVLGCQRGEIHYHNVNYEYCWSPRVLHSIHRD
ncbi:hypothetical protein BKN37_23910 [Mycobacterium talmoniae]|uniref:Uncharacterized protein n=1 Tax=Mycobacterium talmoniae TaxID=1858794 RepID=A0A1S1MY83_9MYCO|nr:hypothetical protein BKN37_23910 [Mycobacterium talmoniae]